VSEELETNLRIEAIRLSVAFLKRSNADLNDLVTMANTIYSFLKGDFDE
jgi:hypothetical protein